jgi:cell division protein FtsI (penicillin-binding protein 3)
MRTGTIRVDAREPQGKDRMTQTHAAFSTALIVCAVCARCAPPTASAPSAAGPPQPARAIDPRIARVATDEIDDAVARWHAARAVVVVLDPTSGEVLAIEGRDHGRRDNSIASSHAWITGSTLKTLTIGAALEEGTISLGQHFPCGTRAYGSDVLRDRDACDSLDAAGILARSSNVGTSYVFDTLGSTRLSGWLRTLHVGDPPGFVPTLADDHGLRAAALAIGGLAAATPLQVAAAYAAVFNDGVYIQPALGEATGPATRAFSSRTARSLVDMLEGAVMGDGTGSGARIAGHRVAGKTGTADVEADGGADMVYASFVGAVLDQMPRFVALVGLEVPPDTATGASAAAPVFARLASRLIGASP